MSATKKYIKDISLFLYINLYLILVFLIVVKLLGVIFIVNKQIAIIIFCIFVILLGKNDWVKTEKDSLVKYQLREKVIKMGKSKEFFFMTLILAVINLCLYL